MNLARLTVLVCCGWTPLAPAEEIPASYQQIGREVRVPAAELYRLALQRSAVVLSDGARRPWPWTVTAGGRTRVYRSRTAAWRAVLREPLRGEPLCLGLLQLSWRPPQDPWAMLGPHTNLRLGARQLRQAYSVTQDWARARRRLAPPASATQPLPFALNLAGYRRFAPIAAAIAARHRLAPELLYAVIAAESNYRPRARSPAGAQGLMQLMPATARRFAVADPFDPAANIDGGAHYLRWLLDTFGELRLALAGYNAGEQAVIRHGYRVPPYPETQAYVPRVLAFYRYFLRQAVG